MDAATATLQVAYQLELLNFIHGWAVITTVFFVSLGLGWKLYAGLWP